MSLALVESGLSQAETLERLWRDRLEQGLEARKPFEPTWLSNLAFAAGRHWLVWNPRLKQLRHISLEDPRYKDAELYTADVITEYRAAELGELQSGDDRPELLLAQAADQFDEELQKHLNRCVAHGWEHEWMGDVAMLAMRPIALDLGVAAVRVRFDNGLGKPITDKDGAQVSVPFRDGQPLYGTDAHDYVSGEQQAGRTAEFRDANEGRICWDVGSPFNLIVPPGIVHERDFPWECWVRPVPLQAVLDEYPQAAGLKEDTDIGSILGLSTSETRQAAGAGTQSSDKGGGRLRDHTWLYTVYERPTRKHPKGQTLVFAGEQKRLIETRPALPYQAPDGCWRSGIAYFHFWRRNDAFWSRAFIENLKDPQRIINRRKTQMGEIIDRGMPRHFIEEGSMPQKPAGVVNEYIEVKKGSPLPASPTATGPGPWMRDDIEGLREDMAHASTVSSIRLGENPQNVDTYSALALLNEAEQSKRQHIVFEHKLGVKQLVEDSVYDIRRYWREDKQILISGDDDRLETAAYGSSKVPDFYVVRVAKGAAKPRSQAAELQKVDDVKNAAIAATIFDQRWVKWYRESLDAGQVLELPEMPGDEAEVAELENHLLVAGGQPPVAYWHSILLHLPIHREAQDRALIAGDVDALSRIEVHIQQHLEQTVETAVPSPSAGEVDPNAPPPAQPPAQPGGPA